MPPQHAAPATQHDAAKAETAKPDVVIAAKALIKSDFMTFSSTQYLLPGNISRSLKGGADLSAGVEVVITPKINAWFDINNIFNDKYQRWYNYEVYGINFLAGVIFKF